MYDVGEKQTLKQDIVIYNVIPSLVGVCVVGVASAGPLCVGVCAALLQHDSGCGLGAWQTGRLLDDGQHGVHLRGHHRLSQSWLRNRRLDLGHSSSHLGFSRLLVHLPPCLLQLLAGAAHGA